MTHSHIRCLGNRLNDSHTIKPKTLVGAGTSTARLLVSPNKGCSPHKGGTSFPANKIRTPLNILRVESGEKIFRQMQQNPARVVYPTRRDFVKYHGKDSVDSRREEFLEVPQKMTRLSFGRTVSFFERWKFRPMEACFSVQSGTLGNSLVHEDDLASAGVVGGGE